MSGTASSPVARNRIMLPRWLRITIGIGTSVIAAAFLVWMFWGWITYFLGQTPEAPLNNTPTSGFSMGQPLEQKPLPQHAAAPPPPPDQKPPPEATKAAPPVPPPPAETAHPIVRPMMVWGQSQALPIQAASKKPATALNGDDDDDVGGSGTAKDSAYAQSMQATRVNDDRPKYRRFNPRYTLRKGTLFSCTPPMPISTILPGPLWCDVDEPGVPSMDGTMTLIPAHSQANATIERGLGLGQDSAVLVFTDILTTGPDFLPIPLGSSLGASELGQNGVPVDVNEHTWAKIKTTLMFAGVEGLSSALSASLQKGGNTQYNFGSVSGTTQSLATLAFQHDMNIPTTGYRGPGYPIKVYINHHIDLPNFYSVALRRGR